MVPISEYSMSKRIFKGKLNGFFEGFKDFLGLGAVGSAGGASGFYVRSSYMNQKAGGAVRLIPLSPAFFVFFPLIFGI